MRQLFVFIGIACIFATVVPQPREARAQGDWAVKRDPFDPQVVNRYKRILAKSPGDAAALRKLVALYKRYRSVALLVSEYEKELKRKPKSFSATVVLAEIHLSQSSPDAARALFERAAELRPGSPLVQLGLGDLYNRAGETAKARGAYETALEKSRSRKDKKEILRKLAALALGTGDIDGAKRFYERRIALDPKNTQLRIELGDALVQHEKYDEALEVFKATEPKLRSDPAQRVELISRIGQAYEKAGKEDLAIREYRRAMSMVKRSYYLRKELTARIVEIYRRRQALPDLLAYYEKHWRKNKRGHFEWDTLARLYEETGAQEKAIHAYRIATKKSPYELDTHRRLISLLENSGQEDAAIKQYETVIKVAPGEPRFQLELAERYWRRDQEKKALALLKRMESQFPGDGSVHAAIADLYTRWGKEDLALQAYIRLTRLEPDELGHLVNLGEQYFQRGKKSKAIATWKRIIRRKSAVNYARLGEVYAEHDLLDDALRMYKQAIKLQPKAAEHYKGRARVYERRRLWKNAIEDWERVLALTANTKANKPVRAEARRRVVNLLSRWNLSQLNHRIAGWRKAFAATPPDVDAGRFLVEAYVRQHRDKDARTTLEALLKIDPGDVEAMQLLVKIYRSENQFDKAVALLLDLVKLSPGREREYYTTIAEIKTDAREDDEAIKYVRMALEKSPKDPVAHMRLAERYEAMQTESAMRKAIAAYEKTIELDPRNFAAYFALARLYEKESPLKAAALYHKVLERSTDNEIIQKAGRKAITLEELTGTLGDLERVLAPLAFTFAHKDIYRRILVELYARYVPLLVAEERKGGEAARTARKELDRLGTHGLKPLLEALNDEKDVNQQQIAVSVLGHLGNKGAAAPLVKLATDPHSDAHKAPVGTLIPTLGFDVRVQALVAAGRLGDARLIPSLVTLSKHRERAMREAAIFALGVTRDRRAVGPLLAALDDPNYSVQTLACLGLAHFGEDKVARALTGVLADRSRHDTARAACAFALGAIGSPTAVEPLSETLARGNDETQRLSAWALGQIGDRRALPALLSALFSRHDRVRDTVAWAVARIAAGAPKRDVPELFGYRMRTHTFDADAAIRELPGPLAPPTLIPSLVVGHEAQLLEGIQEALGRHTDLQIRMLTDLDADPERLSLGPLTAGLAEATPEKRSEIEAVVTRIGRALIPDLTRLGAHRDAKVRALTLSVLSKIDAPEVEALLRKGLEDDEASVRKAAMSASATYVARRGKSAAGLVEAVAAQLTSEDWRERTEAARALGQFGALGDQAALIRALSDDFGYVREAAARALGRVGGPTAIPALQAAARSDQHALVREAAKQALAAIDKRKR